MEFIERLEPETLKFLFDELSVFGRDDLSTMMFLWFWTT